MDSPLALRALRSVLRMLPRSESRRQLWVLRAMRESLRALSCFTGDAASIEHLHRAHSGYTERWHDLLSTQGVGSAKEALGHHATGRKALQSVDQRTALLQRVVESRAQAGSTWFEASALCVARGRGYRLWLCRCTRPGHPPTEWWTASRKRAQQASSGSVASNSFKCAPRDT